MATGSRRAEIVAWELQDVNLDEGVMHIRHGKGDKARDTTIVGDFDIWALQEWKAIQGEVWQYVFVPVNKGGVIGPDKAISADTYYNAVKEVSKVVGFDFATHDLRRSLLTELSRMGAHPRLAGAGGTRAFVHNGKVHSGGRRRRAAQDVSHAQGVMRPGGVGQQAGAAQRIGQVVARCAAPRLGEQPRPTEDIPRDQRIAGVCLRHDIAVRGELVPHVIRARAVGGHSNAVAIGVVGVGERTRGKLN
ncbi:MAG TPA: site-specific integrase [Phototrophicaceae bacterium]|nr:site-specific integrase [Phototrophicaceae bacterium]